MDNDPRLADVSAPPSRLAAVLRPKVAIPVVLAGVLLGGPFVFRASQVAGLGGIGEPFDIEKRGRIEVAAADNAYIDYIAAAKLKSSLPGSEDAALDDALKHDWERASPGVRAWVEANRPAMAVWKAGTAKPDAVLVQPVDMEIDTLLEPISDLRDFGRLAQLETSRLESEGRPDEAREWHRALFRSSRHSGMHGCLIERLVGMALHAVACSGIARWSQRDDVDEALLAHMLADLRADDGLTASASRTLQTEYMFLRNTYDRPDLLAVVGGHGGLVDHAGNVGLFFLNEPRASKLLTRHIYANLLEHVDKPLADRPPMCPGKFFLFETPPGTSLPPGRLSAAEIERRLPRSPLVSLIFPSLQSMDQAGHRERTRQRALEAGLAAQIHRRRHGTFPPDLQSLVDGGLLPEVPLDPYARTRVPMLYRTGDAETVIYSIGENGIDDGGTIGDGGFRSPDSGLRFGPRDEPAVAETP